MGHNNKRPDTLYALIARAWLAEVACRCGHKVMLDPKVLLDECRRRGLGTNSMAPLAGRMKCKECGGRPERVGPPRRD